jgi:hypothetical protein
MSRPLVSRSPDLTLLEDEGYDIEIRDNYLLIKHVPYVTAQRTVDYGVLVSSLCHNGTATTKPDPHTVWFTAIPYDSLGRSLEQRLISSRGTETLAGGLVAQCQFSHKPRPDGYVDYHEKMTTYVEILRHQAAAIDASAKARIFPPHQTGEDESVFRYLDAASGRAGISGITAKLRAGRVAIVGLGGTGSYILDLVAKTPIEEIHLFDEDDLYGHNAFRAPGAASIQDLALTPKKVDYLFRKYDVMRRNIFPHPVHIDRDNIGELRAMDFVFLALDGGPTKRMIIENLEAFGVPFIDAGMGLYREGDSLAGIVRVTTSDNEHRRHVWGNQRISFADEDDDEYDRNIQTADLNMLNAVMAVMKWKKQRGFYLDLEREYDSTYTVSGNMMLSNDQAE